MLGKILFELKRHAPFTALGTASGLALMALFVFAGVPRGISEKLFWILHPMHVLISAMVTTAIYRANSRGGIPMTLVVGYLGSVGIATLSDSIIPYAGEFLLNLPHRGIHFGFIEKWWLVNPLALVGIGIGCVWRNTRFPHAGHVFLSTWASLFHMTMAMGLGVTLFDFAVAALFLFLAVWIPCCTSDIVFPLLWTGDERSNP